MIIYVICILGLLHTYIFYPILLKILARSKQNNSTCFQPNENLPFVSILMAAYNEELVIEDKLNSILETTYANHLLNIFIGSDNSTDSTNTILHKYASKYPNIHFTHFKNRQGKPNIINQLAKKANKKHQAENHIFIITDANIIFSEELIFELAKHFKNKKIALVDSNIQNIGMKKEGISKIGIRI